MAQSVKPLTLDFVSGHDLTVRGIEPHVGLCSDRVEPAWDLLPLSLPPSAHALSRCQNKHLKKCMFWGTWLAQLIKHPTPDFSSGHDLTVREIKLCVRLCADR